LAHEKRFESMLVGGDIHLKQRECMVYSTQ